MGVAECFRLMYHDTRHVLGGGVRCHYVGGVGWGGGGGGRKGG